MLIFVLSKFELIDLIHFCYFFLCLHNVSHFKLDRSVNWLIFVFQTGRIRDDSSLKRIYINGKINDCAQFVDI